MAARCMCDDSRTVTCLISGRKYVFESVRALMTTASSQGTLWGCRLASTDLKLLRRSDSPPVLKHGRQVIRLFLLSHLLYLAESPALLAAAFSLQPTATAMCLPLHAVPEPPHPSTCGSLHADSACRVSDNTYSGIGQGSVEVRCNDDVLEATQSHSNVKAPLRHMPRGTRLLPGFPGPQFVSLGPSIRYRRRLRRHRRDEGWQFSNLPWKRKFFAARRNHRDQLMHRWIYNRDKQCKRKAKNIIKKLQDQGQQIFGGGEETKVREDPSPQDSGKTPDTQAAVGLDASEYAEENRASPSVRTANVEESVRSGDCLAAVRSALQICPPLEVLRTMPVEELGRLHTSLRELLTDAIIAVAPPELVSSAASRGFCLPPASAAVASSPLPWWNSGGGLQPWRGRKEARAQQSRRVNWANPRRSVEPTVAGILLPKEVVAVVAAERQARREAVLEAVRAFVSPNNSTSSSSFQQKTEQSVQDVSALAALPWFVGAEDERLRRLLSWNRTSSLQGGSDSCAEPPPLKGSCVQSQGQEESAELQLNTGGSFCALRRSLGAAIDVALHLTEASVTKRSGASAPYSWDSPFLRSATSSKRRRRRERGRPQPGERLPNRHSRRLANRSRRQAMHTLASGNTDSTG